MTLLFPDDTGVRFPSWPTPLDAFAGIVRARGWSLRDKWSLLRLATGWQLAGFQCDAHLSVTQLCQALSPRVMLELVEPLCVSALNTPAERASASVFLRIMQDALFGVQGGSRLLLPRLDLSQLFPGAAADWLRQRGAQLHLGARISALEPQDAQWRLRGGPEPGALFDTVILATSASESARALANTAQEAPNSIANEILHWTESCKALRFEAIATVYAWGLGAQLPEPMLTLRATTSAPAQFVFDRGQLGGPRGLLAFVVSASTSERATLQAQVLDQARQQLGLRLQAVQTIVEKRATFACTPALERPAPRIAPGLFACGDYVAGPYPATLEGAVRSGMAAVAAALA